MQRLASLTLVLAPATQSGKPSVLVPDPATTIAESGWSRQVYTLRSELLQETLHLYVGLPPSFGRAERSYPALFLLDGKYSSRTSPCSSPAAIGGCTTSSAMRRR